MESNTTSASDVPIIKEEKTSDTKPLWKRSPELTVLTILALLVYTAIALLAPTESGEASVAVTMAAVMGSCFLISVVIAIIAVIGGVGGGVIFTTVMLGFTTIDTMVVRATGLVVAMFSGLVSAGPLMRNRMADIKLVLFGALPIIIGSILGAHAAIYLAEYGEAGDAIVRLMLGLITTGVALLFVFGGSKSEYPTNGRVGPLASRFGLLGGYYDKAMSSEIEYKVRRSRYGLLLLVLIGFVGGFFGLGGGWAVVPVYNLLMYVPLKLAAGCSGVLLALGNAAAIWPYITAGALIPLFAVPWMLGQVVGGIIGAHALSSVRAGFVRMLLIVLLFLTSVKLIGRGLEGLLGMDIPLI